MRTELDEEKELLMMKGDALRMKLYAQSKPKQAAKEGSFVNSVSTIASSLNQPVIRSLAVSLLSKKLLSSKFLAYSALGAVALYLLNRNNSAE
ncbi:hypothetical protein [Pasteurella sp. PK-2025]|uniref:hypothetical protein n=1 Tax=unclassified Pasteurella TaxID=2621516 RepID=UPI003C7746E5